MSLDAARISPYIRALQGALDALAPNDEHVPLAQAKAHLEALDPALSGDLLAPYEIEEATGMPSYQWLERARAEAVLAGRSPTEASEEEIARATKLDATLGARMRARRDLHRHLRAATLLPSLRLSGAVRRLDPCDVALVYDRLAPDGRWIRVRAELRLHGGGSGLTVGAQGALTLDPALQHLFTRHATSTLNALWETVERATGGRLQRLSRGFLGPFWYPGMQRDPEVPEELFTGLVLHGAVEVFGADVDGDRHLDPYRDAPNAETIPEGCGRYRERRFAATPAVEPTVRAWVAERGMKCVVVPIGRRRRRL